MCVLTYAVRNGCPLDLEACLYIAGERLGMATVSAWIEETRDDIKAYFVE